jgi:hypothetical protein
MAELIAVSYATSIIAGATLDAVNSAVDNSFLSWNGGFSHESQKKAFRKLADESSVLGFPEALVREQYFKSPIISGLKKCHATGFVYIAYVPSGKGKTTACKVFLKEVGGHRQGIAICPSQTTMPYAMAMLQFLGLSTVSPPSGWMTCLIDALILSESKQQFLLLDDFMSNGPNDFDVRFLSSIKAHFRNTRVIVVVLTQSSESADKMLTINHMIRPLPESYTESTHAWSKMSWSASLLRKTALGDPKYKDKDKAVLEGWINEYINSMDPIDLEDKNPLHITEMLDINLAEPESFGDPNAEIEIEIGNPATCGEGCRLM